MVEWRQATPNDAAFLFQVYRLTHIGSFESLGAAMCERLLEQQSSVQEGQYELQYPQLERFVIWSDARPVGRLYLSRSDDPWVLVDIAICPAMQHHGIGTEVLQDLVKKCQAAERKIQLHVTEDSHARGLYRRLGFEETGMHGPYLKMEWRPA